MNDLLDFRQKVTNRSIMKVAADVCAIASTFFWVWIMFDMIGPEWPRTANDIPRSILSTLLAIVFGLCWALVLPVLCASIFPNTPAEMMLQEYQRRAWGFVVMVVAAIYLFYQSYFIIEVWWTSRIAVRETNMVGTFSIATIIFFVLIPARIWHQSSPAQWMIEVQQGHAVEKLKHAYKAEILLAKAAYLRAIAIVRRGLDVATAGQMEYVTGVMTGLHRMQATVLQDIAAGLNELGAVSTATGSGFDEDYDKQLQKLSRLLLRAQDDPDEFAPPHTDSYRPAVLAPQAHQDAPKAHETARIGIIPDTPGVSTHTIPFEGEYRIAYNHFGVTPWKVSELAPVINLDQVTARKRMQEWRQLGLVTGKGHSNGNYSFTE